MSLYDTLGPPRRICSHSDAKGSRCDADAAPNEPFCAQHAKTDRELMDAIRRTILEMMPEAVRFAAVNGEVRTFNELFKTFADRTGFSPRASESDEAKRGTRTPDIKAL